MRIEKGGAACSELVDVGRLGHGMPPKVADPVVLVIDGDEENVGPLSAKSRYNEQARDEECAQKIYVSHLFCGLVFCERTLIRALELRP